MKSLFVLCCESIGDADFEAIVVGKIALCEEIREPLLYFRATRKKLELHNQLIELVQIPAFYPESWGWKNDHGEHNSNLHRVTSKDVTLWPNVEEGQWLRESYLSSDWCTQCLAYNPGMFVIEANYYGGYTYEDNDMYCKNCGYDYYGYVQYEVYRIEDNEVFADFNWS